MHVIRHHNPRMQLVEVSLAFTGKGRLAYSLGNPGIAQPAGTGSLDVQFPVRQYERASRRAAARTCPC